MRPRTIKKGDRVWWYNTDARQNELNVVVESFERAAPETVTVTVKRENKTEGGAQLTSPQERSDTNGIRPLAGDTDVQGGIQSTPEHPFWK